MTLTATQVIISVILYSITLVSGAFGFGQMWAKKQDKKVCDKNHALLLKEEAESRDKFWEAIDTLKDTVATIARDTSILSVKYDNLEKLLRVDARLQGIESRLK